MQSSKGITARKKQIFHRMQAVIVFMLIGLFATNCENAPTESSRSVRGDLHLYTHCSLGYNSYEEMIREAMRQGLDFIALTELYYSEMGFASSCQGADISCDAIMQRCQQETRLLCIPGKHISDIVGNAPTPHGYAARISVLAIGSSSDLSRGNLSLSQVISEIHQQGGLAIATNIFSYTRDELLHSGFDAMECVYGNPEERKRLASIFGFSDYPLPCVYNSYAYKADYLGWQWTACETPITSVQDFQAALVSNQCTGGNSWQKRGKSTLHHMSILEERMQACQ